MMNHRKSDRRDASTPAHIACGNGATLFCWVHNLSEQGAKLELIDALHTPDRFLLVMDEGNEGRWVETVWRDDVKLGVRFVEPASLVS